MEMRQSKIIRTIEAGGTAITAKLNLNDPRGAEIAAMCGFDALWIDLEHVPDTYREVEHWKTSSGRRECRWCFLPD